MKQNRQNFILKQTYKLLTSCAISTINSACFFGLGQPLENESLKKYKKPKNSR